MNDISNTLQQRGSKYGEFTDNSSVTQTALAKVLIYADAMGHTLSYVDKEAIHMVLHKMARVVCGTGKVKDNWHDIVGYGKLARDVYDRSKLEQCDTIPVSAVFREELMAIFRSKRKLDQYEHEAIYKIVVGLAIVCSNEQHSYSYWTSIMDAATIAEGLTVDE